MLWVPIALLASFFLAAQVEANRHFRADGLALTFARTMCVLIAGLPLLPFMHFPASPAFYALTVLGGCGGTVAVITLFNLAARHSGRVTSMYLPVVTFTSFLTYALLRPDSVQPLLDDTVKLAGVIGALFLAGFAVQFIRRNDSGWQHFLVVLPVGLLFGFLDAALKAVVQPDDPALATSVAYIFLNYVFSLPALFYLLRRRGLAVRPLLTKPLLRAGALLAVCGGGGMVLYIMAVVLAPNSAYPGIFTIMVPFWLMLWNRLRGQPDNASPAAGAVMVLSALALIWFTR